MASFFKVQKHRQFNYKPRYYDPDKEALEKRREELLGKRSDDSGEHVPGELLRNRQMRRTIAQDESRGAKKKRGSVIILIVLLFVLALAVVWVLN